MQVTTTKPEWEEYTENETLNSMVPIWKKSKKRAEGRGLRPASIRRSSMIIERASVRISTPAPRAPQHIPLCCIIPSKAPFDYYTKDL